MRMSDLSSDVCSSDLELGSDDVDEHSGALLEAGEAREPRHDVHVPVERAVVVVWRGVEHQVVGHLAEVAAEQQQRIAQRAPDGHDIGGGGTPAVPDGGAGGDQTTGGGAAPITGEE